MGENTLYKMYSKYILHTKKVSDVLILELAKSWWIFAAMPRATLSTTTYIPLSGLSVFLINSKWHENFTHHGKSLSSKLVTSQIQSLLAVSIINAINALTINWVYVNYILSIIELWISYITYFQVSLWISNDCRSETHITTTSPIGKKNWRFSAWLRSIERLAWLNNVSIYLPTTNRYKVAKKVEK